QQRFPQRYVQLVITVDHVMN
nr:RecName: Full=Fibrinolytic zinc metalloproteinase [Ganoderma lucidum]